MKKIGILTFHYADNYGAVLQAFALYKTINSFSDCKAEFINYVPEGYCYPVISGNCALDIIRRRREKINGFLTNYCGIHTPMLRSVTGNKYDVYVVGSDQVWNTDIPEVAADYEYFLPNLSSEAKRIAYSASIGMDIEQIDRKLFQTYLPKFDSILLREKSYVNVISDLSGKKCEWALDPTMLLNENDYDAILERPNVSENPYLLYFWFGEDLNSIELVNTIARKYDLSIIHLFSPENNILRTLLVNDGGSINEAGIGEFLWYVKNARAVVTNSFHGAVFSILFKKPLYIYYPKIRKCRQEDLVDLCQIQDRVVQGYLSPDKINLDMDYTPVMSILNRERDRSMSYLRNSLEVI